MALGRQDYADIPVESFAWADRPNLLPDSALGFWFRRLVKMNSALHELSRKTDLST